MLLGTSSSRHYFPYSRLTVNFYVILSPKFHYLQKIALGRVKLIVSFSGFFSVGEMRVRAAGEQEDRLGCYLHQKFKAIKNVIDKFLHLASNTCKHGLTLPKCLVEPDILLWPKAHLRVIVLRTLKMLNHS